MLLCALSLVFSLDFSVVFIFSDEFDFFFDVDEDPEVKFTATAPEDDDEDDDDDDDDEDKFGRLLDFSSTAIATSSDITFADSL